MSSRTILALAVVLAAALPASAQEPAMSEKAVFDRDHGLDWPITEALRTEQGLRACFGRRTGNWTVDLSQWSIGERDVGLRARVTGDIGDIEDDERLARCVQGRIRQTTQWYLGRFGGRARNMWNEEFRVVIHSPRELERLFVARFKGQEWKLAGCMQTYADPNITVDLPIRVGRKYPRTHWGPRLTAHVNWPSLMEELGEYDPARFCLARALSLEYFDAFAVWPHDFEVTVRSDGSLGASKPTVGASKPTQGRR